MTRYLVITMIASQIGLALSEAPIIGEQPAFLSWSPLQTLSSFGSEAIYVYAYRTKSN